MTINSSKPIIKAPPKELKLYDERKLKRAAARSQRTISFTTFKARYLTNYKASLINLETIPEAKEGLEEMFSTRTLFKSEKADLGQVRPIGMEEIKLDDA